jgi:hypothetical protein
MDVVGHEAITPDFGLRPLRRRSEQIEVERIIAVLEKRLPPPVPALRDVVGNAGNDDTGKAGDGGAPGQSGLVAGLSRGFKSGV